MRKLVGILAVLALTALTALPSEAAGYPYWNYYCDIPLDCPDALDCRVTGCDNHTCAYSCW